MKQSDMEERCNALNCVSAYKNGSCYTCTNININTWAGANSVCNRLPNGHLTWLYNLEVYNFVATYAVSYKDL